MATTTTTSRSTNGEFFTRTAPDGTVQMVIVVNMGAVTREYVSDGAFEAFTLDLVLHDGLLFPIVNTVAKP